MLELLFLLLPIAAAYGWFMGRNSVRAEQRKEQEEFSRNYVTGI
ncbi:MAG: lipopolysaccharide assembly protein LapB, partial [Aliidiomarina sp.]